MFLLGWLWACSGAHALTVEPYSFEEVVEKAEVIVIGTVSATRSDWGAGRQTIYTWADLVDLEVLKGDVPAAVYRLRVPGGVMGEVAQVYPGVPVLETGQRYVLFVRGHLQQIIPFVGAYQGVYRVRLIDGEERVFRFDRQSGPAFATGAMINAPTLDEFVQGIRDRLVDDPPVGETP